MFACQQWVAGRAAGSWWLMPAAHSTACLLLCEACCSPAAHFPPANPLSCPPVYNTRPRCVFQRPDDRGFIGVELSKDLGAW